jgi:hypothetical protein
LIASGGMGMLELKIHLRANNGQYLCAEEGGGGPVVANRDVADIWEAFVLTDSNGPPLNHGANVTIRVHNGMFFCAEDGGGRELNATRVTPGEWETFAIQYADGTGGEITNGHNIALRTSDSHYICAEGGGGKEVVANRDAIGPWETFIIDIIETLGEPGIRIDYNIAGIVALLSHDLTQEVLDTTGIL